MDVWTLGSGKLTVGHTNNEVLLRYEAKTPEPGQPKAFVMKMHDWKLFMDFVGEMLHEGTLAWPEVKALYDSVPS